jgi:hypothetical protein
MSYTGRSRTPTIAELLGVVLPRRDTARAGYSTTSKRASAKRGGQRKGRTSFSSSRSPRSRSASSGRSPYRSRSSSRSRSRSSSRSPSRGRSRSQNRKRSHSHSLSHSLGSSYGAHRRPAYGFAQFDSQYRASKGGSKSARRSPIMTRSRSRSMRSRKNSPTTSRSPGGSYGIWNKSGSDRIGSKRIGLNSPSRRALTKTEQRFMTRPSPSIHAAGLPVGERARGNDGRLWEVVSVRGRAGPTRRWVHVPMTSRKLTSARRR